MSLKVLGFFFPDKGVCQVASVMSDYLQPHELNVSGSSVHGILQARCWSGLPFPRPEDLPDPGSNSHLFCLLHWQAGSFIKLYL